MSSFTPKDVEGLKKGGNKKAAKLWKATYGEGGVPVVPGKSESIKKFIQQCFVEGKFARSSGEDDGIGSRGGDSDSEQSKRRKGPKKHRKHKATKNKGKKSKKKSEVAADDSADDSKLLSDTEQKANMKKSKSTEEAGPSKKKEGNTAAKWACPACTYHNEWKGTSCEICTTPRPLRPEVVVVSIETPALAGEDAKAGNSDRHSDSGYEDRNISQYFFKSLDDRRKKHLIDCCCHRP